MTDAFHIIPAKTDIPLFIFGDHASFHIPDEFDHLGLSEADRSRHIAWDIGTDVVVKQLCAHFGCRGQLAGVSRLVIDFNRDPEYVTLIPEQSDGTVIPGNQNLTTADRQSRIERFHKPYHAAIDATLKELHGPFVISVHSFTPELLTGERRTLDIGLLVKHDEQSAHEFYTALKENEPGLSLGINEPYSAHILNYTVDTHLDERGLCHLAIEIRQDHIDTDIKAKAMAERLAVQLEPVIANHCGLADRA